MVQEHTILFQFLSFSKLDSFQFSWSESDQL